MKSAIASSLRALLCDCAITQAVPEDGRYSFLANVAWKANGRSR